MTNGEKFRNPDERQYAFSKFCSRGLCAECYIWREFKKISNCKFIWLDLEYEEELKPCPFCGGKAKVVSTIHEGCEYHHVECTKCHGSSIGAILVDKSIDAWNRRVS